MIDKTRLEKVKSILVSQPKPSAENSPYHKLSRKYDVDVDFRPFIHIEPVNVKDFRKQKVDPLNYTAVIFTSRNAVDHFFGLCKELKIEMP